MCIQNKNKKVLLRDRKRHTTRRVASTRSAGLSPGEHTPVPTKGCTPVSAGEGRRVPLSSLQYPPGWDWGIPPGRTWDQRPGKEPGTEVLPRKDLGPPPYGQAYICENSTFPIIRMRAVIMRFNLCVCLSNFAPFGHWGMTQCRFSRIFIQVRGSTRYVNKQKCTSFQNKLPCSLNLSPFPIPFA